MPEVLVFGGSGQIGAALLPRLVAAGWQVHAVSRDQDAHARGVRWLHGSLEAMPPVPARLDAIVSCGPLDHFARWFRRGAVNAPRVVAFGSTSASVKQNSADAAERALAAQLRDAEASLAEAAGTRGTALTLLRPTLVYGIAADRTLTRIAGIARRTGWFVLPSDATGRRQPVHVKDLADAAMAALQRDAAVAGSFDLPGGETLRYRDMVGRVLSALVPPARLLTVPPPLFSLALAAARGLGGMHGFTGAARLRLREDLVFDAGPARAVLGYAPRAFAPTDAMFRAGGISG